MNMADKNLAVRTAEDLLSVCMEGISIFAKTAEDLLSASMERRSINA